jgi:hypothetical protein
MPKYLRFALILLILVPFSGVAQQTGPKDELSDLLEQIRSKKKEVVQQNMDLSEAEAAAFWPIYDSYQRDLQGINARLAGLISSYADAYAKKTLSNGRAKELLAELLSVDADEVAMRKRHAEKLEAAVSGRTAVRYLQIENKIRAAVRYQLADKIPLVK